MLWMITGKESEKMTTNDSQAINTIDDIIQNVLTNSGNPLPFNEAKKILGEILNATNEPLSTNSDKERMINKIIGDAVALFNKEQQ